MRREDVSDRREQDERRRPISKRAPEDPRAETGVQHAMRRARQVAIKSAVRVPRSREELWTSDPRIEEGEDGEIYLRLPGGQRWRVHDVRMAASGRVKRVDLQDRVATHRAFVVEDKTVTKLYRFHPREGRGLSGAHLADQLAAAEVRS